MMVQVQSPDLNISKILERIGLNLETSVDSRKSAQALDALRKPERTLITQWVTTIFSDSLSTPISCTAFSRSTEISRLKVDLHVSDVMGLA